MDLQKNKITSDLVGTWSPGPTFVHFQHQTVLKWGQCPYKSPKLYQYHGIEKYKITADLFGKWDRNIQNTENQKIPLHGHYK